MTIGKLLTIYPGNYIFSMYFVGGLLKALKSKKRVINNYLHSKSHFSQIHVFIVV